MEYALEEILDVALIQALQDKLNLIIPFSSGLIDLSGKILTSTAWQDICTKFHRLNPESELECIKSNQRIHQELNEAKTGPIFKCSLGLIDMAVPIVIEGEQIASFFSGQFFLDPPDFDYFKAQAIHYGFNEEAYLEAVKKVPVVAREQLQYYQDFIKNYIESLATVGLAKLREIEITRKAGDSELRFRRIIEDTEVGYFFIDKEGIIRDVNNSWARMYKYEGRDEIIGHHFMEIQRFEDQDKATAFVERILAGDPDSLSGEFSRRCKDGSVAFHTFSAKPVITDGEIIGIEGFIIDSTDQKIAEIERDASRARLATVFDKMIEGFALHEIICDENGNPVDYRFLDVNPAFESLAGLKGKDIIGKTAREVMPDMEPYWIEKYGKVALSGEPLTFENYAAYQKKHYRVVAFSNQKGQFATIFDDITDRLASEERLKTLAHAIDSIQECVSMTDTENNIIFVNRAFCNTYGYSREELVGRNISLVRSPGQLHNSPVDQILSETLGGGWSGEAMNRRKDGTDFPVHISTAIVDDYMDHPVALIGIATDITERRKNQKELIAAKERAEESDRLKSAFLANISHEIRTPMNSILGFSDLLEELVEDPKQLEYLKIITTGGERLLNIINSVIDIAKIEAGQITLSLMNFDINQLMQELFELNKRRNVRIEFICDTISKEPLMVHSDKTKLFQIFNNLLSNALKFTMSGSVRFGYTLDSGVLTFYVKDTGIGIPDEFHAKVFDRFQKVELHDRADYEGTGLGLAITKELVSILNGELWFESEKGIGTTFFVRLPV